jgi:hypothetical protein
MYKLGKFAMIAALAVSAAACAVNPSSEEVGAENTDTQDISEQGLLEMETVAKVPTPTGEIAFHVVKDEEGVSQISVSERGSMEVTHTPLREALSQQELTALEIFLAISDEEPPAALIEAHPAEAQALGRPDSAVLETEIDLSAPVQKWSVAECDAVVYWDTENWLLQRLAWNNQTTEANYYNSRYTTSRVRFGLCNDGTADLDVRYQVNRQDGDGYVTFQPSDPDYNDLGGGQWMTYSTVRTGTVCNPWCVLVAARYRMQVSRGSSGTYQYDVRVMEVQEVVK